MHNERRATVAEIHLSICLHRYNECCSLPNMADANNSQKINLNFEEYSLWTLWLNVIMILKLLYGVAPDACPAWLPNLEIVYFKCPGHEGSVDT